MPLSESCLEVETVPVVVTASLAATEAAVLPATEAAREKLVRDVFNTSVAAVPALGDDATLLAEPINGMGMVTYGMALGTA
jgi:hypothetical protein